MVPLFRRVTACFAVATLALLTALPRAVHGAETAPAVGRKLTLPRASLADSPLEVRLLNDAADGRWNEFSLFTAAQIAGGATGDAEMLSATIDYAALTSELHARLKSSLSTEARAAAVLSFLHHRLLSGGYDLNATTLSEAFATGRFNCVSATVLYNCLAAEAGLTVHPLRLPQHTCSLLFDGDRRLRVEATCLDWFEARHRTAAVPGSTEPHLALGDGAAEVGQPISDVALVAMIYYNRGVDALRHNDFEQAIRLNRLALLLDADNSDARGNLLSAMNKRALELAAQSHFAAAVELVEQGLSIEPDHAPLRQNRMFIERARENAADGDSGAAP